MDALTLPFSEIGGLTDKQLFRLCASTKELRIERTSKGDLIVMSPAGGKSSFRSLELSGEIRNWNKQTRMGITFDSSIGFLLHNGAMRSPDVAWVAIERWNTLADEEQEEFIPLCPDFVADVMSKSDRLTTAQEKMREWIQNGCRLGWLFDPSHQQAYIYRADGSVTEIDAYSSSLSGEDVLPSFTFDIALLK
jgi:Uma2 family endonuclease